MYRYLSLKFCTFILISLSLIFIEDSWGSPKKEESSGEEISEEAFLNASSPIRSLKRLRRTVKTSEETLSTATRSSDQTSSLDLEAPSPEEIAKRWKEFSGRTYSHLCSRRQICTKDESDDEDETEEPYRANQANFKPESVIILGTRLKLLTNVYLRNLDEMANIFFPRYTITIQGSNEKISDFFRAPSSNKREGSRGKICLFASGGLYHTWEKTVAHIQEIFFKNNVKIIRAAWIQKHLIEEDEEDLEKKFRGKENELHSEYYYDIFFQRSFMPWLKENHPNATSLEIMAYSWWDVCNNCESRLTNHRDLLHLLLSRRVALSYQVASNRHYRHTYQEDSVITEFRVSSTYEQEAWELIWKNVTKYAKKDFHPLEDKEKFWTQTKNGLELCKWLGQAFVENAVTLNGKEAKPSKKGDILKFYKEMAEEDTHELRNLLDYLREKNWDLSCWYKGRCPDTIQGKWKKYWRQVVVPHFNWKRVGVFRDEGGNSYCEMCGNQDVVEVNLVFHPKFHVSENLLKLLIQEEQEASEEEVNINFAAFDDLPPIDQKKRRQSLCVGSECVKTLLLSKKAIDKWHKDNPKELVDAIWKAQVDRQNQNEAMERADKKLKERKRKSNQLKGNRKGKN